jgi:hypothetical protein
MKIVFFIFIIIAGIPLITLAQNIPNGNFEIWSDNHSGMPQPHYWETQNEPEIVFVEPLSGHTGKYAACLNIQWDEMLKQYCSAHLFSEFYPKEKIKYTNLSGYIKGNAENIDSLFIEVYLYFGSSLIGSGTLKVLDNTNNWRIFKVPIQYISDELPDKVKINITVNPDKGSHFLTTYCIDDLLLTKSEAMTDNLFFRGSRS